MAGVKPVAGDDYFSFAEDQTIEGNLLSNDLAGSNGVKYLRFFDGQNVLAKKVGQVTDIDGEYGTFHVKADGTFTYTLHDDAKVGFYAGMTLSENLSYKISDGAGNTDVAIFKLDIQGVTVKPVAVDDQFAFSENDTIGGNVLANDTPGETGQLFLRSVDGTSIGAKQGSGQVTDVAGEFGTFHFSPDGAFTYDLDAAVKAGLDTGESVTETLKYYKVSDGAGHTDVGVITVKIDGVTDAPLKDTSVLTFEDATDNTFLVDLGKDDHGLQFTTPVNDGSNAQFSSDWHLV